MKTAVVRTSRNVTRSLRSQTVTLSASVGSMWIVFAVNALLGGALLRFGIVPRTTDGLVGILVAPFLHANLNHLIANTIPFLIFGWLVMLRDRRHFLPVTLYAMLGSGLLAWMFGAPGSVHVGASGVIFGYLGFLLLSGWYARSFTSIVMSVGVAVLWGGAVMQVLPGAAQGDPVRLRLAGPITEAARAAIYSVAAPTDKPKLEAQFDQHDARLHALRSPAERDVPFAAIPQLCVRIQGELELIERETLGELIEFDLLRADARPELPGFDLVQQSDLFEIYLEGERVRLKQADTAQLSLDSVATDATELDLVQALERQVRRAGLTQTETQAYVQRLVSHLLHDRGLTLTGLIRSRFQLGQMISKRIDSVVANARNQGFQNLLFGRTAAMLTHDLAWTFQFRKGRYPVRQAYEGRWDFKKHYYSQIAKLKSEGEEFECAKALDREEAVKHWVRNLEQLPEFAFWLPTATDYFYPDFVADLKDGRLLVVEYKGDAYATNDDSREKRLVGERWAQTTGHRFVMVEKYLNGMDMTAQIRAAIRA